MKQVIDYQISDVTMDHAQYFPGVTAYGTRFTHVQLGAGNSERSAIMDAIDQIYMDDINADIITDNIVMRFSDKPLEEVYAHLFEDRLEDEDHELHFYAAIYFVINTPIKQ